MMEKDQDEPTTKQNELQVVLTEYSALRNELLQKFEHQIRLFYLTIIVFMAVVGYILTRKEYDVLVLIPIFIIPLVCRYIWEQSAIGVISRYIEKEIEQRKIPELIYGSNTSKKYEKYWMGYQHYWVENTPKSFHKPAAIFLFVIIPFAPSLLWSIVYITSIFLATNVQSSIPLIFHIAIFSLYVSLAFCFSKELLVKKYLFSIDTKFEGELNNGIISEELKKEFEKNGFSLPDNAAVKKEKEKKWAITDEKKFIIRKEEGKLNIYVKKNGNIEKRCFIRKENRTNGCLGIYSECGKVGASNPEM